MCVFRVFVCVFDVRFFGGVGCVGVCVCVWFLNGIVLGQIHHIAKSAVKSDPGYTSFFVNFREERRIMDFGWFENIMRDGERETCSVVVLLLCVCVISCLCGRINLTVVFKQIRPHTTRKIIEMIKT